MCMCVCVVSHPRTNDPRLPSGSWPAAGRASFQAQATAGEPCGERVPKLGVVNTGYGCCGDNTYIVKVEVCITSCTFCCIGSFLFLNVPLRIP